MRKILLGLFLGFFPIIGKAATQTYIPSTSTYQGNSSVINIASGTIRNFTMSTVTVSAAIVLPDGTPSSPAIKFNSDNGVGIIKPASKAIGFVTNSSTQMIINGVGQKLSNTLGTACLPAWSFAFDAGTGIFMPLSDNLAFGIGCSTGMVLHQHDFPVTRDNTLANIYTVYGGSSTVNGDESAVDVGIYTSTLTTTDTQVMQVNQLGALIIITGHDLTTTNGFTDVLLSSFYNAVPIVIVSHDDLGSPSARTYSAGSGSTGIVKCHVASGNYLTQAYATQLRGK